MSRPRKSIPADVQRLLWGIAAGRCEFRGCNKVLYRHSVTGAKLNLAEKAHIHAVSIGGPRYLEEADEIKDSIENLMLVCAQCHVTIDRNVDIYTPEILLEMKREHEQRIHTQTSVGTELSSHMVFYTSNISDAHLSINEGDARNALTKYGRYPSEQSPIDLGIYGDLRKESDDDYFTSHAANLQKAVQKKVAGVLANGANISLFALAPQPLLMLLGRLLNDKYNVSVFQCHRREHNKWHWGEETSPIDFVLVPPKNLTTSAQIALVFALSSAIHPSRIVQKIGDDTAIYTITIDAPNRDFVNCPAVMDEFVSISRETIDRIKHFHGKDKDIHVFSAMPSSLAIRFGMDYMPKTDNRLLIYDENPQNGFIHALTIGGQSDV